VGPTRQRVREGERRRSALTGRLGPNAELGRGGLGWVVFFFFLFFSFSFQILFKPNSKPFKFKSFSTFQTQILTQIYSNILRLLENLFKHFKFKLSTSFFFNSNFYTNFTNFFSQLI
jgi:hypothetical protein